MYRENQKKEKMKIILTCDEVHRICRKHLKEEGIVPEDERLSRYVIHYVNKNTPIEKQELIEFEFEAFVEKK